MVLLGLGLHCDRPVVDGRSAVTGADGGRVATPVAAPSGPVADAASRTIASLRYGSVSNAGGVDLTCTPDGAATGSFMNAGFSPAGAEILPVNKRLTPAQVAELWAAAEAVARAMPAAHEAGDPSWAKNASLSVHFADGGDDTFAWSGDGTHPDKLVAKLAALLERILSQR